MRTPTNPKDSRLATPSSSGSTSREDRPACSWRRLVKRHAVVISYDPKAIDQDEHRQGDLLADDHEVRNAESRRRLAVGGPHRRRGAPRPDGHGLLRGHGAADDRGHLRLRRRSSPAR